MIGVVIYLFAEANNKPLLMYIKTNLMAINQNFIIDINIFTKAQLTATLRQQLTQVGVKSFPAMVYTSRKTNNTYPIIGEMNIKAYLTINANEYVATIQNGEMLNGRSSKPSVVDSVNKVQSNLDAYIEQQIENADNDDSDDDTGGGLSREEADRLAVKARRQDGSYSDNPTLDSLLKEHKSQKSRTKPKLSVRSKTRQKMFDRHKGGGSEGDVSRGNVAPDQPVYNPVKQDPGERERGMGEQRQLEEDRETNRSTEAYALSQIMGDTLTGETYGGIHIDPAEEMDEFYGLKLK